MARGHNANRVRANNPNHCNNQMHMQKKQPEINQAQSIKNIQDGIERHWESMPEQAKKFILETRDFLNMHKLAKFWSQPSVIEYTRGNIAGSVCGASWFMALNYLKLGMESQARALTLNGSFLHQCYNKPIEEIVTLCGPDWNSPIKDFQLPLFSRGFYAARNPQLMAQYLQRGLPKEYQHMMTSFVNISSPDHVMHYVDQIGDDWSNNRSHHHHKPTPNKSPEGTQLQIILVNDRDQDDRHPLDIGSSTSLKTLFTDYAEKRGVSLRSLRFSYEGKTLFLSSVSNKTPDEMNMRDQDIITVHDTTTSQEPSDANSQATKSPKKPTTKKSKDSPKKTKGKKKKQHKHEKPSLTLEECKTQHSQLLTKLHEEAEPQLREIRLRLNALDLERQPPKQKKKSKKKKNKKAQVQGGLQVLPNTTIGGKAGKPFFNVQVGEVQNLYKTTKKPSLLSSQQSPSCSSTTTLDLHGDTKEEALSKLDETLKVWVDTAMQGSYPFVMSATIVCGCGSQVLCETVERWIKSSRNVRNAPKQ